MLRAVSRITYVWLFLSLVTLASWSLAEAEGFSPSRPLTIGVLAIAAVKVRLVLREFMEVRTAPGWLRRFTDIWLVALLAAIVALYLR